MAVQLDHPFSTSRQIDDSFSSILDLERLVPCVEGGTVPRSRSGWERCR